MAQGPGGKNFLEIGADLLAQYTGRSPSRGGAFSNSSWHKISWAPYSCTSYSTKRLNTFPKGQTVLVDGTMMMWRCATKTSTKYGGEKRKREIKYYNRNKSIDKT